MLQVFDDKNRELRDIMGLHGFRLPSCTGGIRKKVSGRFIVSKFAAQYPIASCERVKYSR